MLEMLVRGCEFGRLSVDGEGVDSVESWVGFIGLLTR